MYVGKVFIEPQDILDRLTEEDKKRFNQCVFTDVEKRLDGSIDISYVVFKDDDYKQESKYRVKYCDDNPIMLVE